MRDIFCCSSGKDRTPASRKDLYPPSPPHTHKSYFYLHVAVSIFRLWQIHFLETDEENKKEV
jgi:hypothetical protein